MKKQMTNSITLGIIFLLWFCLAFECKNGNSRRSRTSTKSTPSTQRKTDGYNRDSQQDSNDMDETDNDYGSVEEEDRTDTGNATSGALPAGHYQCATTVSVYAGQGGSSGASYPIYNTQYQIRDSVDVYSDGTYRADDGTTARYKYTSGTGRIQWQPDAAFGMATDSRYDAAQRKIFMKMGNENWDCGIE